jgi:hypothetical protein
MNQPSPKCPIPNTHRRLDEAHQLWHEAADAYEDPNGFRVGLNALIQALRNVTFILQKEKRAIPDFDGWYEPWREIMRQDSVLVWLVGARNRVVKEGDLETFSTASAGIQASWDEPILRTFEVPALLPTLAVAGLLASQDIPEDVRKQGVLTVERRWVASDLPEWELLDALGHAYGMIERLIKDAHRQAGAPYETLDARGPTPHPISTEHTGGRLPCMVATAGMRTVMVNLRTGQLLTRRFEPVVHDDEFGARAAKRYGLQLVARPSTNDPLDWAGWYMGIALQVFARDKWHAETVFLFHPDGHHSTLSTVPADQQAKYSFMNDVAAEVQRFGYTGLVLIADSWYLESAADLPPGMRPSEVKSRKEALTVTAARSDGHTRALMTPYTRRFGRIRYGATIETGGVGYFLAPVMKVWGVSWPSERDAVAEDKEERAE